MNRTVDRDADLASLARVTLAASARLLTDRAGTACLDDPEDVHQARVGTRRLRSQTRLLDAVLEPSATQQLDEELKWFAGELGRVRDADVLLELLRGEVSELDDADRVAGEGVVGRLRARRDDELRALSVAMASGRFHELIGLVTGFVDSPPFTSGGDRTARPIVIGWVSDRFTKLRREVRGLPDRPSDDQLHHIRKRAKRVRYASELAAPVSGRDAEAFADRLADLQDVLGALHDAVVMRSWLRDAAGDAPRRQQFVLGVLDARFDAQARACRDAWPPTWKRVDRKKRTRWMR